MTIKHPRISVVTPSYNQGQFLEATIRSVLPKCRRAARYRRAIVGLFAAKDIVVWSPEEIEEWKAVPNAFISTVLREGRVLVTSFILGQRTGQGAVACGYSLD